MSRFTPGPWSVWDGALFVGGGRDLCIGAGEKWLANMDHRPSRCPDVYSFDGHPGDWDGDECPICTIDAPEITAEQEANARLIAASPDLLEACEAALAHIGAQDITEDLTDEQAADFDVCLKLAAAIAKARGEDDTSESIDPDSLRL